VNLFSRKLTGVSFISIALLLLFVNSGRSPFLTDNYQFLMLRVFSFIIYCVLGFIVYNYSRLDNFYDDIRSGRLANSLLLKLESCSIWLGVSLWALTWLSFISDYKFSTKFFGSLGVLTSHSLFSDLSILLSQVGCVNKGLDPYMAGSCNYTALNYPYGWIYILKIFGLSGSQFQPVVSNETSFLLVIILILTPFFFLFLVSKYLDGFHAIGTLFLLSPPFITLILQGNNDLLILYLVLASAAFSARSCHSSFYNNRVLSNNGLIYITLLCLSLSAYLKLSSVGFLLSFIYEVRKDRVLFLTSILSCVASLCLMLPDIPHIVKNSTYPIFHSYGIPSMITSYNWLVTQYKSSGSLVSSLYLIILILAIATFLIYAIFLSKPMALSISRKVQSMSFHERYLVVGGFTSYLTSYFLFPSHALRLWMLFLPIALICRSSIYNSKSTLNYIQILAISVLGAAYSLPFSEYIGFLDQAILLVVSIILLFALLSYLSSTYFHSDA
jgi:hypothetical protein